MSLGKQTIFGLFWTFGQQFGQQIVSFIVQIVLARILLPEDFGTIALFTVLISVANSLVDSGLTNSLIRSNDIDNEDYSTVFYFNIVASLIIYGIIFCISPYVANFYNIKILDNIIKVFSVVIIINSLYAVQKTKYTKELKFKNQFLIELPSLIIAGLIGVCFAKLGFGIWSLVFMGLIQSFLQCIQYWFFSDFRPTKHFDRKKFNYHFNFGYKITLSGVINSIFDNIYPIIIGKLFSVNQLGYYNRADSLKQLPISNISKALNKVTFPLFAKYQDNNETLKDFYKNLLGSVLFVICPVMLLAIINSKELIEILLTEKWLPIVPYFKIMCLIGILYPLHSYNLNILQVKGRSDLFLRLEVIKKILLIGIIFLSFQYGIMGLLWGNLIHSILCFFINTYYSGKFLNYGSFQQIADLKFIIIINLIAFISTYLLFDNFVMNAYLKIASSSCMFVIIYLGISYVFKIEQIKYINKIYKKII
ncbi:lipopolysaccharide biosynthesis protein [Empedobacter sp. GD03865]|uniref:lipopolysaccharide biosynthesis protein n=1 Tax=Empedobacter sp. GD03865 TaxID=2975392 RepID=UPI0024471342|nr:lipopolysaccharide biosynthesis protein [Empedobacter sp. GD03865]MDH0659101.1 lipopolysaccharide biosynthesis protein [Empedobacter sp. GD03865]